jgi:hypothetical protein
MNQTIKKLALALAAMATTWSTSAQGTTTITLIASGSPAFNQLDAYLRSGAGVTFQSPGFFNFTSPAGGWSNTFWIPTIVSANGPPFLHDVAVTFDEPPGLPSFSVDFYTWNGNTLVQSFNISLIDGVDHTSAPASVIESGPFVVPEPSILALASVCATALAASGRIGNALRLKGKLATRFLILMKGLPVSLLRLGHGNE